MRCPARLMGALNATQASLDPNGFPIGIVTAWTAKALLAARLFTITSPLRSPLAGRGQRDQRRLPVHSGMRSSSVRSRIPPICTSNDSSFFNFLAALVAIASWP